MALSTNRKIVLVKRPTRLDELVTRFNSVAQARFYIEHLGADFSDYQAEHEEYYSALNEARQRLEGLARLHLLARDFLPNFIFNEDDVVVAVGQDGLVANTLKYLQRQSLIGVNPAPRRWDGVLLPFSVAELSAIVPEVLRGLRRHREVTMAAVRLSDGQALLAVNDFFIGQKTHVSARYRLSLGERVEAQSSSGIVVSTGLGATGWLKSILAGSAGIVGAMTHKPLQITPRGNFRSDSDYLYFSVREPFPSRTTSTDLVFGEITPRQPLRIVSQMAENGVIFSDGIESDFLEFNAGTEAVVTVADRKGLLVV